jgi:NitT/TauT family transport system substrate-binding protein
MKRCTIIAIAVVAVLALSGLGVWSYLASQAPSAATAEPITVAWSPFESTAIFWVAEDRAFFRENGLCVTLRRYDSGAATLDGLVNGEAEIAVGAAEYPLVRQAFRNASLRTIGCLDRGEFIYLVARKDRGIGMVEDLRGKRLGTTVGTISEFHLVRYLNLRGMALQDVTLVDLTTPEEWVNATADGTVDAIATSQPYANEARDRLGENAVVWPLQSSQPLFALVIATDGWIEMHPGTARKFLASLAGAEAYVAEHPDESKAIVQRRLDLDAGYMDTVWEQNRFSLSLDQSLVAAMEDEARWMIANNLTNATAIPDFGEYIDATALEQVRPESVGLIAGVKGS